MPPREPEEEPLLDTEDEREELDEEPLLKSGELDEELLEELEEMLLPMLEALEEKLPLDEEPSRSAYAVPDMAPASNRAEERPTRRLILIVISFTPKCSFKKYFRGMRELHSFVAWPSPTPHTLCG